MGGQKFMEVLFINKGAVWASKDCSKCFYVISKDMSYGFQILKRNSLYLYEQCLDIVAYDQPGKLNRFTVIYIIASVTYNTRSLVYIETSETAPLISVSSLFASVNWSEREIWDLFGVFFLSHPDLRRILTDYGFKGHPLRKDFPLTGYLELSFNTNDHQLTYTQVQLLQEYRAFLNKNK